MFSELLPLPVTWLAFYVLGRGFHRTSQTIRCYAWAVTSLVLLLIICGLKTWSLYLALGSGILLLGQLIGKSRRAPLTKAMFVVSIVGIVQLILVFLFFRVYFQKYFVYLPSLSYLGFRGIAYLTTVYRRRNAASAAGAAQMFFLPVLFVGPITRVENYEEEVRDYNDVLRRLALGLAMLIAGEFCGHYVLESVSTATLETTSCARFWLAAVANSFELYFVFAGYSHLIIGLGLLAGFRLPENFNSPYLATSISEFWRRWHMSLSYWIRDYVYIPLGGSRRGTGRKCFNLVLAMGVCGMWHGLEWHYVLWGLFHGALLSTESVAARVGFRPVQKALPAAHKPVKIATTFLLVTFGWLLFKYPITSFVLFLRGLLPW